MALLDDFNRANGALGSNWSYWNEQAWSGTTTTDVISGNKVICGALGNFAAAAEYWNPTTFGPDCSVEAKMTISATVMWDFLGLRLGNLGGSSWTGYMLLVEQVNSTTWTFTLVHRTTQLYQQSYAVGSGSHVIKLEAIGNAFNIYSDGSLILSTTDPSSTYMSAGYVGQGTIRNGSGFTPELDDFGAETLASGTDTSDTRNARITGALVSSDERNVRLTGQDTSFTTSHIRITGAQLSNVTRDARIRGAQLSNQTRDVRLTGQNTSSKATEARVRGQAASSITRDARTFGVLASSYSVNVSLTAEGQVYDTEVARDTRITGAERSSTSRDTRLSAEAETTLAVGVRIRGQLDSSVDRGLSITGSGTSGKAVNVRMNGVNLGRLLTKRWDGRNRVTIIDEDDSELLGEEWNGALIPPRYNL